jgi:hypothetical protein
LKDGHTSEGSGITTRADKSAIAEEATSCAPSIAEGIKGTNCLGVEVELSSPRDVSVNSEGVVFTLIDFQLKLCDIDRSLTLCQAEWPYSL